MTPELVAAVEAIIPTLGLDEDDVEAATRRGLLLAAAGGDLLAGIAPGSRAVLETASDLADRGIGTDLMAALGAAGIAAEPADALESLAAILLYYAVTA